jgi:hypothetical protein
MLGRGLLMSALLDGTPRVAASRRTRRLRRLGLASVAAGAAALVAGVVYAFLQASGGGFGSASTGSVSIGSPATTACTVTNLAPGDLTGSQHCSFGVTYSGSVSAYMSLTVEIQATSGSGGSLLYNGTNTSGLTLSISDGHNTFAVPTGAGTVGGTCPAGKRCWTASNDLAAWYSGSTPSLAFGSGNAVTWTVTPLFAKTAGNGYQGGGATVKLTAQAVQAAANPLPASCTTSTVGQACPASGTFTWS